MRIEETRLPKVYTHTYFGVYHTPGRVPKMKRAADGGDPPFRNIIYIYCVLALI